MYNLSNKYNALDRQKLQLEWDSKTQLQFHNAPVLCNNKKKKERIKTKERRSSHLSTR